MEAKGIDRRWIVLIIVVLLFAVGYVVYSSMKPTQAITGVVWRRSGGFAGLDEDFIIRSDGSASFSSNIQGAREFALSESEWGDLKALIIDSGVLEIYERYGPKAGVADFFTYHLQVERGSESKELEWVDGWASREELPEGLVEVGERILALIHGFDLGAVEGLVLNLQGKPISGLIVGIVKGSVGFPEIAVITDEAGFYQIASIPPGVFMLGVHDETGSMVAQGTFHVRGGESTVLNITVPPKTTYEYYGGVGLFEEGIYMVATHGDPTSSQVLEEIDIVSDYWGMIKGNTTQNADTEDFISILISRGDQSTGGYLIQLDSQVWLEGSPVEILFNVNFTDPGENVMVTEAITNPIALISIGNLSPGRYIARAQIHRFIMTYDESGNPLFTPIKTLVAEILEIEFEIS
jgi:hypothetical protein